MDDGSTDDTSQLLHKYGSRVEYLYQKNGGQASALNLGFANTRGDIVALLDADDFFLSGKLARVAAAFAADPALGMVYHRFREWHVESDTYSDWPCAPISGNARQNPYFFLSYEPQPTSCLAFRRSCLAPFLPIPEQIRMLADCFPAALMPFRFPVLGLPEFLSVYRIHKKNSYYASAQSMPPQIRQARLEMWRIIIPAMREWLTKNGLRRSQLAARIFLDRWALFQEGEEFRLRPPARLSFVLHLLRYTRCYASIMSRRLRFINYLNAFAAILTGYRHFAWLVRTEMRWTTKLRGRPQ